MFKRIYFGVCFLFFIAVMYLAFITFKPITAVAPSDVSPVKGTVTQINIEKGDIYITLLNDSHKYYINNATKHNLNFETFKSALLKKEVTLYHINKWTPFTTDKVFPHISKLVVNNKVLFNEIIE